MDLLNLSYTDWSLVGIFLAFVIYKLGTWNHNYFSSRGVKNYKTVPFLGSMSGLTFRYKSFADIMLEMCSLTEDKIVGFFQFHKPMVVVKDPELIKMITVKDFDHFMDHQQTITEAADPMFSKNLFSLRGDRWRDMRNTLSPAFTTSKMKNMFNFMNDCGQQLEQYLEKQISNQESGKVYAVELKDLFTRFANDVIATSAFGIQIDSLLESQNSFYKMGRQVTNFQGLKSLIFLGFMLSARMMEMLGIGFFTKKERKFFEDLVHDTITTREKLGIVRPDMIHLLMQARKGELKAEQGEEETLDKANKTRLEEEDIVAQAMIFFFAGFDTASTLLSFTGILLATHEDVQRRLQEEIDETLGSESTLTYDKVQSMKYLDMVISESLRIYPPGVAMDRLCVKDYTIPIGDKKGTLTIKAGQGVWIPSYGIQHDPENFPDPEKFDPERFSDENKHNIKPYTYMPFGVGPRLCIGQRFALLEAKVALVHILSRYNLVVVDKTPLPLTLTCKGFVMAVEGGFWVGVTPRNQLTT